MDLGRLKYGKIISAMLLRMIKCQILYLGWSVAEHKSKLKSSPAKRVWACWLSGDSRGVSSADQEDGQTINRFPGEGVNNSILKRTISYSILFYSIPYGATEKI